MCFAGFYIMSRCVRGSGGVGRMLLLLLLLLEFSTGDMGAFSGGAVGCWLHVSLYSSGYRLLRKYL